MSGLGLLKDDIYIHFPPNWKESEDPEWREFADILNKYRDELVSYGGTDGIYSIEDFDSFLEAEKISDKFLLYLANHYNAKFYNDSTYDYIRQRIFSAVPDAKLHCTVEGVLQEIERITGVTPRHIVRVDTNIGWDELNNVNPPFSEGLDFKDGLLWDEDNSFDTIQDPLTWTELAYGVTIDLMTDITTYPEKIQTRVKEVIAEYKPATTAIDVGYYDATAKDTILWVTIYSTDLAMTDWPGLPDPGLDV